MTSIYDIKTQEVTDTPVLLFDCTLPTGAVERWSTHAVVIGGNTYTPRVLKHNLFDIRFTAEDGVDGISKVAIIVANADSHFSQIERSIGWKGSQLTVTFAFYDLVADQETSDSRVLFRGLCNPPDEIAESQVRLSFVSRLSLQRTLLPEVRIQRLCPWVFPSTSGQRTEGVDGQDRGKYSRFFPCGYSADLGGGVGNMNGTAPFTTCDYSRSECEERGMFSADSSSRVTRRFGGIEFVPSSILVKSYGDKSTHLSTPIDNEANYNDFVPMVYGTAWYRPPVVFARNDGNLTHLEVLLGLGEINSVVKVIAAGVEIPLGHTGTNMNATGWFNIVSLGNRTGSFNLDFTSNGAPLGDPYGSMGVLSVVLPNRLNNGSSLPIIDVLLEGIKLSTFDSTGAFVADVFTNNPVWILLDVLRRCGWDLSELDVPTFATTAAYCDEMIDTVDLNGTPQSIPRFQCNIVLTKRRTAADLIRGIRNNGGLYLTYGLNGQLTVGAESSIAIQQSVKPAGSNSTEQVNGGWPAYEFGDGSNGFSDLLRKSTGEATVRLSSRTTAATPNRFTVEFQDQFNEYQGDSLSLVDFNDAILCGQEVTASLTALGLPNFNQAGRIIRLQLDKAIRGNTYIEFETGLRAIGLKPGDLITVSYAKEGFVRQLFRVLKLSPGLNYRSSVLTAQFHDDSWYVGTAGGSTGLIGGGRQPGYDLGLPGPLVGSTVGSRGETEFGIDEQDQQTSDGAFNTTLSVSFSVPGHPTVGGPGIPLLSLAATGSDTGGTLNGGSTYYYAVSAVDSNGAESETSFIVRATTPTGTNTCTVTLQQLSFPAAAAGFNVYRGANPSQLLRIAQNQTVASSFVDTGLAPALGTPVDRNFHHGNFYWRLELFPETQVSIHSSSTVGNSAAAMIANEYAGKIVRITQGTGAGQERTVSGNTTDTLTIATPWDTEPDTTSFLVVSEASWQFGAVAQSTPAVFQVPSREGSTIEISGRAANVHDGECSYELSPLTRYQLGGPDSAPLDTDVPPAPIYAVSATGDGTVTIAGIGFTTLVNTKTINAGTLTLHFWDETAPVSTVLLSAAVDDSSTAVSLATAGSGQPGSIIQVDLELMTVRTVGTGSLSYVVERGAFGSTAAAHAASAPVTDLPAHSCIIPFVKNFFGSAASGSFSYSVSLPDVRIVASELYMSNGLGNGAASSTAYTPSTLGGIRTLSGGQLSLQIQGYLAIQTDAVPRVSIDASHSVRDIFAIVGEAPTTYAIQVDVKQDDAIYCSLTINPFETVSNTVDGSTLPPLLVGSRLGLDVTSVGHTADSTPGRDLTVTVRL
jgi:hypothetical protein